MLVELSIRNFALISDISLRFGKGFNIITGETGAGKSILIDALQTLLGARARQIKIRAGTDCARLEGLFAVEQSDPELSEALERAGIEPVGGELVIRRDIYRDQPGRCLVNGSYVTVGALAAIGRLLVEFHGQQEGSGLKETGRQLAQLDAFGDTSGMAKRVGELYSARRRKMEELRAYRDEFTEIERNAAGLEEDIRDIDAAELEEGVEEELRSEKELLENYEKIAQLTGTVFDTLSDDEDGVNARLAGLDGPFTEVARLARALEETKSVFDGARLSLEEVARRIGTFLQDMEYEPGRLEELRNRLTGIARVKRRFGSSVEDVLAYRRRTADLLRRKDELGRAQEDCGKQLDTVEQELTRETEKLSALRSKNAKTLERAVIRSMGDLGLEKGRFVIECSDRRKENRSEEFPIESIGRTGRDRVRFMIGLNPGEPLLPLTQVASGGELSRIMLAVKAAIAEKDRTPTLVFDEIDAGIGGEIGIRVGDKLAGMGRTHQVLAVTHLAQIAVRADQHIVVHKFEDDGRTEIGLSTPDREERAGEIARMLGGDAASAISRRHAREMLQAAGGGGGKKAGQ